MGIKILSTGSYLPDKIVSNFDMEKLFDTSDEWITKRTGIKTRRYVDNETNSELAINAVKKALKNIDTTKITAIITATFTPDSIMPNISSIIHKYFNLQEKIFSVDINMACSGFCGAIKIAENSINIGEYAIIIGTETISKHLNMDDRSTAILFGDGAGCIVVEKTPETTFYDYGVLPDNNDLIMKNNNFITMNGANVFKFATKQIPITIQNLLNKSNLNLNDIDYFILHQANERILQNVAKQLNVCENKFYNNIPTVANTSAASIPIVIDEMNDKNLIKKDNNIILVGFGAGLIYCSTLLKW